MSSPYYSKQTFIMKPIRMRWITRITLLKIHHTVKIFYHMKIFYMNAMKSEKRLTNKKYLRKHPNRPIVKCLSCVSLAFIQIYVSLLCGAKCAMEMIKDLYNLAINSQPIQFYIINVCQKPIKTSHIQFAK